MKGIWANNKEVIIIAIVVIVVLVGIGLAVYFGGKKTGEQSGREQAKEEIRTVVVNRNILGSNQNELSDAEAEKIGVYVARVANDMHGAKWGSRDTAVYTELAADTDRVLLAVVQSYKEKFLKDFIVELEDEFALLNGAFRDARERLIKRINTLLTANT